MFVFWSSFAFLLPAFIALYKKQLIDAIACFFGMISAACSNFKENSYMDRESLSRFNYFILMHMIYFAIITVLNKKSDRLTTFIFSSLIGLMAILSDSSDDWFYMSNITGFLLAISLSAAHYDKSKYRHNRLYFIVFMGPVGFIMYLIYRNDDSLAIYQIFLSIALFIIYNNKNNFEPFDEVLLQHYQFESL